VFGFARNCPGSGSSHKKGPKKGTQYRGKDTAEPLPGTASTASYDHRFFWDFFPWLLFVLILTPDRAIRLMTEPPDFRSGSLSVRLFTKRHASSLRTRNIRRPARQKRLSNESIVVLTGTIEVGGGEVMDPRAMRTLPSGSFILLRPNESHFLSTSLGASLQIIGTGQQRAVR
jgi:hypothetical protein